MKNVITWDLVGRGYAFMDYLRLIEDLLAENRTTGNDQSDGMIEMTRLNLQRLKRIYKTCKIKEPLKDAVEEIDEPLIWLMVVEAWCGDGAQIAPYFAAMADLNPLIQFKLILRDENPELMDMFLTDGKRSIPKFICLDANLNVLTSWGPRPAEARKIYHTFRENPRMTRDAFHRELHLWYARDKGISVMDEISDVFRKRCTGTRKEIEV